MMPDDPASRGGILTSRPPTEPVTERRRTSRRALWPIVLCVLGAVVAAGLPQDATRTSASAIVAPQDEVLEPVAPQVPRTRAQALSLLDSAPRRSATTAERQV